jgi:hypothetical protein
VFWRKRTRATPPRLAAHEAFCHPAISQAAHKPVPHPVATLVPYERRDEQMISRKLTKPAVVAAAAAIAVGGGTYTASGLWLAPTAGADQIQQARDRNVSVNGQAHVHRSAAAVGLARDFGITRAAAQELIDSAYS